jgi:lipopolysaccharide transport system permease protein
VLHIWEILTQIGFWITPILYSINYVPIKYLGIYMLNPLARIIEGGRNALIYGRVMEAWDITITVTIVLFISIIGYFLYDRNSKYFAEEL